MAGKSSAKRFTVEFIKVGPNARSWTAKIARPVVGDNIIQAVHARGVLRGQPLSAPYDSDYSGFIYTKKGAIAGSYVILPGSEA